MKAGYESANEVVQWLTSAPGVFDYGFLERDINRVMKAHSATYQAGYFLCLTHAIFEGTVDYKIRDKFTKYSQKYCN